MNYQRTLCFVAFCCIYTLSTADESTTEWSNITTLPPPPNFNSTQPSNSSWPPFLPPFDNETDAVNFIVTDYANESDTNSSSLEHFTKFNWTVLDGFDYTFGGTDDIRVNGSRPSNVTKSRAGYDRDLMVVLPVMQGNSDLSNSNLQVLYTKPPVTAIIGGEQNRERKNEPQTRTSIKLVENQVEQTSTQGTINKLERIDHEIEPQVPVKRYDLRRYPLTDLLFNNKQPVTKPKSPLDYGYPDTLKFIEDFNELPKNHRPNWNLPDVAQTSATTKKSSSYGITKRDPFQMFESVKPLEINKLLSFKAIPVTDSIAEETTQQKKKNQLLEMSTELPIRPISKRPSKRPAKKPQKNKTTVLNKSTTHFWTEATTKASIYLSAIDGLYNPGKHSNTPTQTTPGFLPTPYKEPSFFEKTVETTTPKPLTSEPLSTSSMAPETTKKETPTTTTVSTTVTSTTTEPTTTRGTTPAPTPTTTTTITTPTPTPTTQSSPASTTNPPSSISTTECSPEQKKHQIKPSDLLNLKKILDEEFGAWPKTTTQAPTTRNPSDSGNGDLLTGEMRNMLIALGLLKADGQIRDQPVITTTTTNNYLEQMLMKRDPATPTIDPHSYVSFKKIPIDFGRQQERLPVSDDMKDLLTSFGLLPKRTLYNSLSRLTRHHKMLSDVDISDENNSTSIEETVDTNDAETNSTSEDSEPIENLDTLTPLPFNYVPHEKGHVFHPTIHLETLGDENKLREINRVIDTIKKLSQRNDTSIEEIEQNLETINSLVSDETAAKDPFLSEVSDIVNKTKTKIKLYKNKTLDLKTNTDVTYSSDESSIVSTYSSRDNYTDLTQAVNAPNPLSSDELQQLLETHKNEVKRQQPSNNTSGSAPLSDLAASFGGGETASEAPLVDDMPTAKPNGLYFFVDWNSFLNVGDDDKNGVRLKFSPRAGNARNFLPITLP